MAIFTLVSVYIYKETYILLESPFHAELMVFVIVSESYDRVITDV